MESAASRWHLSSLCFAFLVGRCRITRKSKSTPLTRYSYHERDYARLEGGQVLLKKEAMGRKMAPDAR